MLVEHGDTVEALNRGLAQDSASRGIQRLDRSHLCGEDRSLTVAQGSGYVLRSWMTEPWLTGSATPLKTPATGPAGRSGYAASMTVQDPTPNLPKFSRPTRSRIYITTRALRRPRTRLVS